MFVRVNGESMELPAGSTLSRLLDALKIPHQRLAVELNGEIVPKSRYSECILPEGATLEILRAVGGG